ncbi:hypothetical protein A2U01_0113615, partial [Trifolium medium]|nr:hypothetical protein [Trifolium medium]
MKVAIEEEDKLSQPSKKNKIAGPWSSPNCGRGE